MKIGKNQVANGDNLFFIAGPCVIETYDLAMRTAEKISKIAYENGVTIIYKSSYEKGNRTSGNAYRGPGLHQGLEILAKIKESFQLSVTSDVHASDQVTTASEVLDLLQIPAFLMRQTDLIVAASMSGRPVHFKKAQFMSPAEVEHVVNKAKNVDAPSDAPKERFMVGERGSSFGYNDLVVDMRALTIMSQWCPIVFDATHSTQSPGARGFESGGDRRFTPALARAAVSVGVAGVFIETHPQPERALCDSGIQWPLDKLEGLIQDLIHIDSAVRDRSLKNG